MVITMNELQEKKVYDLMYKLNLKPQTVNHLFWDLIDRKAVDPEILAELMNFNIKGD